MRRNLCSLAPNRKEKILFLKKKIRRQVTGREKIFVIHTSDKGLLPTICEGLLQLNIKTSNAIQMGKNLNRYFTKEDMNSQYVY